jgi:hypothetical protein
MKKYKISESNLNEFWGWFGKKKPQTLQNLINNDPELKQIDRNIQNIFASSKDYLLNVKKKRTRNVG